MTVVEEFVQDVEAIRLGGNPVVADTRPPAEITTAEYTNIKNNANAVVRGETGIASIDDGELAYGLLVQAANFYAAYLIRTEWTDKGDKIPQILAEYQRLIKSIAEYEDITLPAGGIGKNFTVTSAYKSHGLNPDVEPYISTLD